MPIVSDSGPILSFARANLLDCLRDVAGELIVPYAVHEEILGDLKMPGSKTIAESVWITRQSVRDPRLVARLHRGEREAIALAKELGAALLVDDRCFFREVLLIVFCSPAINDSAWIPSAFSVIQHV
ncbi:hypothetical protein MYX82_12285 [Acidobacteria bacterium AH-259-D05]|nr:hypothetical protein [Acidobacteria bacterium AH-259-D05]